MKLINAHPIDVQFHPAQCRKGLKDDGRGWALRFALISGYGLLVFLQVLPHLTLNQAVDQ